VLCGVTGAAGEDACTALKLITTTALTDQISGSNASKVGYGGMTDDYQPNRGSKGTGPGNNTGAGGLGGGAPGCVGCTAGAGGGGGYGIAAGPGGNSTVGNNTLQFVGMSGGSPGGGGGGGGSIDAFGLVPAGGGGGGYTGGEGGSNFRGGDTRWRTGKGGGCQYFAGLPYTGTVTAWGPISATPMVEINVTYSGR